MTYRKPPGSNTHYAAKLIMDGSKALGLSVDEEFNMMRCLTHPSFVRWYSIFDLGPHLSCKAILMDICDGDCHSLIYDHQADIGGKGVPGRDVA